MHAGHVHLSFTNFSRQKQKLSTKHIKITYFLERQIVWQNASVSEYEQCLPALRYLQARNSLQIRMLYFIFFGFNQPIE